MKSFVRAIGVVALIVLTVTIMSSTALVQGLDDSTNQCPVIVREAWSAVDSLCSDTGNNRACYGHVLINAQAQPDVASFAFEQEGDTVHLADIQNLRLSAMNTTTGLWGVALMRLQANLPASDPDQNATMLLFGDVKVENAAPTLATIPITSAIAENINIRQGPYMDAWVLGSIAPDETVVATGRLEDGSWLRIQIPDTGGTGWVFAPLLTSEQDIDSLAAVEGSAPYYGPMQAFVFESGMDDALCDEAPDSGLLIQTPEGVAKVSFLINEVEVQLGSTIYFQAEPGGSMIITVVEGSARVRVGDVVRLAVAGTRVSVPLGENGRPSGPPGQIEPYELDGVVMLPVDQLPRAVSIHTPLTQVEVDILNAPPVTDSQVEDEDGESAPDSAAEGDSSTSSPTSEGDVSTEQDGDTPPGLIDNPGLDGELPPGEDGDTPPGLIDNPGLDGELPPGQGGETPPGQTKKE